jgi:hypothetical protein
MDDQSTITYTFQSYYQQVQRVRVKQYLLLVSSLFVALICQANGSDKLLNCCCDCVANIQDRNKTRKGGDGKAREKTYERNNDYDYDSLITTRLPRISAICSVR